MGIKFDSYCLCLAGRFVIFWLFKSILFFVN